MTTTYSETSTGSRAWPSDSQTIPQSIKRENNFKLCTIEATSAVSNTQGPWHRSRLVAGLVDSATHFRFG